VSTEAVQLTANDTVISFGLNALTVLVQFRVEIEQLRNGQFVLLRNLRAGEVVDILARFRVISAIGLADRGDASLRVELPWDTVIPLHESIDESEEALKHNQNT
jgi:hypothetical protein